MSGELFRSLSPTAQDWLEATVHLTVRIRVSHTSQDRPDDDRVSVLRGSGCLRVGTGFIDYFITPPPPPPVSQPRPFLECGGTVVRKHSAFIVRTAQHVTFDVTLFIKKEFLLFTYSNRFGAGDILMPFNNLLSRTKIFHFVQEIKLDYSTM